MNLSTEKIAPFAVALAEAVSNRASRLSALKNVRLRAAHETAEELEVSRGAYRTAKRNARAALAAYDRARGKVIAGEDPGLLDADVLARLKMYGWNF